MPTILITNDDGVHAPGLLALKQALSTIADVVVLAPERNWSASSHAKTMHKPLRVTSVRLADGSSANVSSGSPTDCVALAAGGVLGVQPDLVVAGINNGHNLGVDVTYSGTVACAMEATIKGIPGIAVSSIRLDEPAIDIEAVLDAAAQVACRLAQLVLASRLPAQTLLNVNVPGVPSDQLRGMHVTRMGGRNYHISELVPRHDPSGKPYYWLGGSGPIDVPDDGSDVGAVQNGFVSVTPISLDMTDIGFMQELFSWGFATPTKTTRQS
ncbi:MAG: 5'/3'-nucleotidase SurE [Caldilineaceae bacterium]|nr:5'/3'-nucleotidase SurE [Caldilineaceae bacterium]